MNRTHQLANTLNRTSHRSAPAYLQPADHLFDELRWLDLLLAAQVLRLRQHNFYSEIKDFRRFFIADEEVDALLADGPFGESGATNDREPASHIATLLDRAGELRDEIDQRVLATGTLIDLSLARLVERCGLSAFERHVLLICLAPVLDARYEKLYAYLHNDFSKKLPTIDLVLSLLCRERHDRLLALRAFEPTAPLRRYHLIDEAENNLTTAAQSFLAIDRHILHYLLGSQAIDARLDQYASLVSPIPWEQVIIPEALRERLALLCRQLRDLQGKRRPSLFLHGRPGTGKKSVARALCGEFALDLLVVDFRSLVQKRESFAELLRLVIREQVLQGCALFFEHVNEVPPEREACVALQQLRREVAATDGLVFFGSGKDAPQMLSEALPLLSIEIPAPDHVSQKRLWQQQLNGASALAGAAPVDQLVSQFVLTGGQIASAVRLANLQVRHNCAETQNGKLAISDLLASCRQQWQMQLDGLAQKIEPVYTWADLILPQESLAQLREVCQRVRHRQRVLGEWGFGRKLSQGRGINALFAGPSGTGKTMAAEIIANDLQLDLYRIDLAGVVSKYIGETEKNVQRIFSAAEHANAILFFDEADALFGKRSEVRDAHDRYANIETAYLLQKMEQHDGVTILATNLRQNIDAAFTRRLAFTIHFPFPDESSRRRIWQHIWPAETPLAGDVDVDVLATRFKLSGGNIRNVALAAAFLAAEHGGAVSMQHLQQALRREYQKLGKELREEL